MSTERLAEIQARAKAATAGPWGVMHGDTIATGVVQTGRGSFQFEHRICGFDALDYDDDYAEPRETGSFDADVALVAHGREDIPWLLQQIANRDHVISLLRRAESWDDVHSIFAAFDASEAQS